MRYRWKEDRGKNVPDMERGKNVPDMERGKNVPESGDLISFEKEHVVNREDVERRQVSLFEL